MPIFTQLHARLPQLMTLPPATTRVLFGYRSFSAAGTRAWNSLPPTVTAACMHSVIIPSLPEISSVHKVVPIMTITSAS